MKIRNCRLLALLALTASALAKIPVASHVFVNNGSAYILSPSQLQILNVSGKLDASSLNAANGVRLPFDQSKAYTPISAGADWTIVAGDCGREKNVQIWHYKVEAGTWEELSVTGDASVTASFLSAGFSFSPTTSINDTRFYTFGGMCPNVTSDEWTINADYNNDVISYAPDPSYVSSFPFSSYEADMVSGSGPPVKEAGLTITPLLPSYSESSADNKSQQQNFVLLGGHTQQAFINMSQVALFSLPQETWFYQAIRQPSQGGSDLVRRSSPEVEPRSGHTAILNSDGSKIIVFGGWVGDVSTPAEPQLAVLELGKGYGGDGKWTWTIPSVSDSPLAASQGIYGHAAALLEGDVMFISGGYLTSASRRRSLSANGQAFFYNTTSSTFIPDYTNPSFVDAGEKTTPKKPSGLHTTSQKAGLSAGLVLGLLALAGIFAFYFFYSRRLRHKRLSRDSEVRDLALGPDRLGSAEFVGGGMDGRGGHFPIPRPTSWASRQDQHRSAPGDDYPWAPVAAISTGRGSPDEGAGPSSLDTNIPAKGRRLALARGVPSPISPRHLNGRIHTIDEEDEGSRASASLRRAKRPTSTGSDPFKDPPPLPTGDENQIPSLTRSQSETDKMLRQKDFQSWNQDWDAAGKALDEVHNTSPTKSTHTAPEKQSDKDKSDNSERTKSNLSDTSNSTSTMSSASIQRSVFSALALSRTFSLRSSSAGAGASAGYTLFANAAAAMTGRATLVHHPGPTGTIGSVRGSVRGEGRSVSLNAASSSSNDPSGARQRLTQSRATDRSDTFSSAITHASILSSITQQPSSFDPDYSAAALGPRSLSSRQSTRDHYATPPESPVKDRYPGIGMNLSSGLGGWMGGVRRALTGVVERRVRGYEERDTRASSSRKTGSPTRDVHAPEMMEVGPPLIGSPRRATSASAALWKGKRGAKDWDVVPGSASHAPGSSVRPISGLDPFDSTIDDPETSRNLDAESEIEPQAHVPGPPGTVLRRKAIPRPEPAFTSLGTRSVGGALDPAPGVVENRRRGRVGTDGDGDWDVEAAVQSRLVQVMFTVPKERLRVVNADVEGEGDGEEIEEGGTGKEKGIMDRGRGE